MAVLFCFFCSSNLLSQSIAFNHLTVEHGLVNYSVLSISQDANGFMWLGTRMGLNRYDGVRFHLYKSDVKDSTSLSNNDITTLFTDSKQTLWIGTSSGLDAFNPRKDAFERIWINGSRVGNIFSIYEDRKGRLWIGSSNGLHLLTDRRKKSFQSFYAARDENGIAGNIVRAIFEDHDGNLWIGTNNGLTKMKWQNGRYQFTTFRHEAGKPGCLSANYITSIAEDAQHKLWIGTQNAGVDLYDPATNTFTVYSHRNNDPSSLVNNNIRKILLVENKIWAGTQEGLSIIDPATKKITSYQHDASNKKSLSQNSIYSLFEDANGSVWAGTYFGGANITYSYTTSFHTFQNNESRSSLSNNVVSSIVEDGQHNLWIGTEGGGLNFLNRATGLFTVYKNKLNDATSLGSNLVKVVYVDKEGNPWAGTHGGGLCVLDRKRNQFRRYLYVENDAGSLSSEITSLAEDEKGRFWVVGNIPLRVFRKKGTELQPIPLNEVAPALPQDILAAVLFKDAAGNIWIGRKPGLYKFSGNAVKIIDTTYNVNCIGEDPKGNIWLGLSYGGLARYDSKTGKVVRYEGNHDFSSINVVGLLADDKGNIWLSTDNGLVKFTPAQNRFQTYTVSDGLAGNEFNYNSYLKDSRGELFFGGFNGFTSFFPDNIQTNKYVAPVVFTGLKLFNNNVVINDENKLLKENISLTKELVFKHDQDAFTIEFALLNFIKSNKNKYAYKLEGFDKDWNEVTTPFATYTNLPSGLYTFWVKGANNDGVWSRPASIKIKMLPPWWLSWWAYCIYAIVIAAILFLVTRFFFLRELLKKEDELHQVKLNFFTNISHEIRTHLTLIMTPVEQMIEQKEKNSFDHQQLTQVKGNAHRLLKLVNELMDFRKAETQNLQLQVGRYNLIPFLQDIYTSFRELSLAKNVKISFIHDTEDAPLYFDKEQLEKVFFNLLVNAFKFTPAGGQIILQVEQKEQQVNISVIDNGRGIAPQYLDKLFNNFFQVADHGVQNTGYGIGLALSKHIVELHKGSIRVESEPAKDDKEGCTVFTVTLLQGNTHLKETVFLQSAAATPAQTISTEMQPAETITIPRGKEHANKAFTILIAEDNPELRALIQQSLIQQYHILSYENGLRAWEAAIEHIPDLIISDVMMPEMDGFTFCEKLKTDERTSHIPVILLTAKSSQNDQISGLETGADVYITKPFSTKVLELNVRNLLASREKMRHKFSRQMVEGTEPDLPVSTTVENTVVNKIDKEFLNRLIQIVEEHIDNPEFGVDMLSKKLAMSAPILYKKLKALTDLSVNDFVKSLRLKKAAELLLQKQMTVYEVAYAVGYNDRKYFSKEFKKQFGKTPSEFSDTYADHKIDAARLLSSKSNETG
jgi:ligand-binding sensor domain-containing protein/signal transduction histidine kinase/DNA-binding response OmpR family regulator